MGKTKGIALFLSSASPPRVWNKAKNRKTDGFIHLQFLTDFVTVIPHLIKSKLTPTKLNSVSFSDKPASQQTSWNSVKGRFYFLSFWFAIIKTLKLYLTYLSTLNASCTYLPTHPNTSFTSFFFFWNFIHICFLISISVLIILIERSILLDAEVTAIVSLVIMYSHSQTLTPSHK